MLSVQSISSANRGFVSGANARNSRSFSSLSRTSYSNATCLYTPPSIEFCQLKGCSRLVHNATKREICPPVCASREKGNSMSGNEPFSWDSLKKVFGGFRRELTVQDMLREKARQKQFDGDGGDGISGGGGGGGGDGDGSGGPADEGFAGIFDEFLQVILAVVGVVFLYTLMITGEELTRLARDYVKYLLGFQPSVRLKRNLEKWRKFYESITLKKLVREDWLERKIVATPTWWHDPSGLAYLVGTNYESYRRQRRLQGR